ncbi:MAG: quinone-dependent dihydroorotate dehydrogenase [Woeseiaceae bacterium]
MSLYRLARPLLFSLDPETAHLLTLKAAGLFKFAFPAVPPCPRRAMGLEFANPVGAAAGLDKHAEHIDALAALGFGFLELGGVTPRSQAGNPRPRLFRIPEAGAIINRFGLNSVGAEAFVENLKRSRAKCIIGVNIGKNRDTPNERAADDYERCLVVLYPHIDYVSINVSSPNTKGMRDLQSVELLTPLLRTLFQRREALRERHGRHVALALKISPDIDDVELRAVADVARHERVDGIVATNTTVSRESVRGCRHADEDGGLSGAPLRERSTTVLRALAALVKGELPLIGVGGIMSGDDAREKFAAGASLVQIYTGLVYRGPSLISECGAAARREGLAATAPATLG